MIAILQISCRMWQWKTFENRPVVDEVMCRQRRLTFFGPPCIPEVIEAHTLNFKPNFKFSRLILYEPTELFCLWTKFHQSFFRATWKGLWLIKFFSDVRYVDPFRRYLRPKSKVVKNRAEIWTFFWPSPIFFGGWEGAGLPKVVCALSPVRCGTSYEEVSWRYSHQSQSYWGSYAEF